MKIQFILLQFLALLLTISPAFSQSELDQQLTITQNAIDYLTNDIRNHEPGTLHAADYRKWKDVFQFNLERQLTFFQNNIKQKVFGPLQDVTRDYMATYNDSHLSFDQKNIILNSLRAKMYSLKPFIEEEYHKSLKDLYAWHDLLPYDFIFHAKDKSYSPIFLNNSSYQKKLTNVFPKERYNIKKNKIYLISFKKSIFDGSKGYIDSLENFSLESPFHLIFSIMPGNVSNWKIDKDGLREDTFKDYYPNHRKILERLNTIGAFLIILQNGSYDQSLQRIIEGCESKSCIALKAADLAYYYVSIKNMLDKGISVKLPNLESDMPFVFPIQNLNLNIDPFLDLLKRTDFSKKIDELPFDTNN